MATSPRLLSLATAVPRHRIDQSEIERLSFTLFDPANSEIERMRPVFGNAGIETRYSCVPLDWCSRPHGWAERSRLYVDNAVDLLADAATRCLAAAGATPGDVDGIVLVSTTGIATPSIDALLMERLAMRRDTARLPIFGLGCAGGVAGLGHAAHMAAALGGMVLLLVVELCALTFRHGDNSKSNIVAAALFGDGAAAALIGMKGKGPALGPTGSHTWASSLDIMGWRIEEDGFGVRFSRDIPALVRGELRSATEAFLKRHALSLSDIAGMVCHPGGIKVIEALESSFGLPSGAMTAARDVLRDHGNMSAATVLFVLERVLAGGVRGRQLLSALGPGFTANFQILEAA